MKRLRVLIYKRTHTGDPTREGVFGCSRFFDNPAWMLLLWM